MDISEQMETLKSKRQLFHSEADFQFAIAWEIQKAYPGADIRLEYCPRQHPTMHIDIVVFMDSKSYPIELKYKTLGLEYSESNESFSIKNHGAQDIGRYDCLKDIERVERLSKTIDTFEAGFVVILSNDPSYWIAPKSNKQTICDEFRIHEGLIKTGTCRWGDSAGKGTTKNRERPINLAGKYQIEWSTFSHLNHHRNGTFKYTVIKVDTSDKHDRTNMKN